MSIPSPQRIETLANEKGLTLIEVLISIAIFAVGILGVCAMQYHSMNGNASARRATEAGTWAQDTVEKLIAMDPNSTTYPDWGANPFVPIDPDPFALGVHGPFTIGGSTAAARRDTTVGTYSISWLVQDSAGVPGTVANTLNVTVTVARGDGENYILNYIKPMGL